MVRSRPFLALVLGAVVAGGAACLGGTVAYYWRLGRLPQSSIGRAARE